MAVDPRNYLTRKPRKPAPRTRPDVRDDYTMADDGTRKRRRSTARPPTPYKPKRPKPVPPPTMIKPRRYSI